MKLDRDDRAALAQLSVYAALGALALAGLLLAALAAGFAVHLFQWAA